LGAIPGQIGFGTVSMLALGHTQPLSLKLMFIHWW